jgi:peptide/nickel transport system permease protein
MTTALPESAQTEAVIERRLTRIPGLAALRATAGFQRGMLLAGALLVLFFVVVAVFAGLIAPYGFNQASANGVDFPTLAPPSARHTGSARRSAAPTCSPGSSTAPGPRSRSSCWSSPCRSS